MVAEVEDTEGCAGIVCVRGGRVYSGSDDDLEIRLVSVAAGLITRTFRRDESAHSTFRSKVNQQAVINNQIKYSTQFYQGPYRTRIRIGRSLPHAEP